MFVDENDENKKLNISKWDWAKLKNREWNPKTSFD